MNYHTDHINLHNAIILRTPVLIDDTVTQNQMHACHCRWFPIAIIHLMVNYEHNYASNVGSKKETVDPSN